MPTPILPIASTALQPVELPSSTSGRPGEFKNLFESSLGQLEGLRADANQAVETFLSGQGGELHSVVLATQRAELAFELGLQLRNKVVQAYQEVMRMQM
jgi:flagellar hook-basal body complex protein FliE